MWLPVGYDTPINECWNTIERAGIWDVSVGKKGQAQLSPQALSESA